LLIITKSKCNKVSFAIFLRLFIILVIEYVLSTQNTYYTQINFLMLAFRSNDALIFTASSE
jgi:uncharacterized integral membrane protein